MADRLPTSPWGHAGLEVTRPVCGAMKIGGRRVWGGTQRGPLPAEVYGAAEERLDTIGMTPA